LCDRDRRSICPTVRTAQVKQRGYCGEDEEDLVGGFHAILQKRTIFFPFSKNPLEENFHGGFWAFPNLHPQLTADGRNSHSVTKD